MTRKVTRRDALTAIGAGGTVVLAGCTTSNQSASGGGGGGSGNNGTSGGDRTQSGSGGGSGKLSGTIDIAGSSTVFPLATAMSEEFRKKHSGVKFNIQSTGSGGGFENFFCTGKTDFNNASRPIQPEEKKQCQNNNVEPVELQVATDALTVIVNPNNDWVDCMTTDELKQIWSAKNPPKTWSDVNSDWPDEPLDLYGPTEASGTYDYFLEAIIGEEGPGLRTDYQATEQDRTIIQGVQQSDTALGFLGFAYYSENKDSVKVLAIDDGNGCVKPSLETAKSGKYTPLSRPLFTYPAKSALSKKPVAEFAKFWMENSTSKKIVADRVGYVPLDSSQQKKQMQKLQQAIP